MLVLLSIAATVKPRSREVLRNRSLLMAKFEKKTEVLDAIGGTRTHDPAILRSTLCHALPIELIPRTDTAEDRSFGSQPWFPIEVY